MNSPHYSVPLIYHPRVLLTLGAVVCLFLGWAVGKPLESLIVLSGIAVTVAVFHRPAIGAAAILALAPLDGILMVNGHSAIKLVSVLCVAVLVLRELVQEHGIRVDRTVWYTVGLLGWAAVTILWTPDPSRSFTIWFSLALQALLYVLLLNLVYCEDDLKLAIWGHVIGGTVLAIILIQHMVMHEFRRLDLAPNLGLNLAARLTALSLLLAIILYHIERNRVARLFLLGAAALCGVAVVAALSRGAWYELVCSIGVLMAVLALTRGVRVSFVHSLGWCAAAAAVLAMLSSLMTDQHAISKLEARVISAVTFSDSASQRFEIWRLGWSMFLDAPLVGHGISSFSHHFPAYIDANGFADIFHPGIGKQPHNTFVRVATEQGLIGLVLWSCVLFSVLDRVWSRSSAARKDPFILACALSLLTFVILSSMVDSSIDRKYTWYGLCLVTLMITLRHRPPDLPDSTLRSVSGISPGSEYVDN